MHGSGDGATFWARGRRAWGEGELDDIVTLSKWSTPRETARGMADAGGRRETSRRDGPGAADGASPARAGNSLWLARGGTREAG